MKKPPRTATELRRAVPVLSISPSEIDHESLKRIFEDSSRAEHEDFKCVLYKSSTLESALAALQDDRIKVVISACELKPGTWKDVLAQLSRRPDAAPLIVTSRLADDCLWAEALNLGAYDVLAKPFDRNEVIRVVAAAWRHCSNSLELAASGPQVWKAASGM